MKNLGHSVQIMLLLFIAAFFLFRKRKLFIHKFIYIIEKLQIHWYNISSILIQLQTYQKTENKQHKSVFAATLKWRGSHKIHIMQFFNKSFNFIPSSTIIIVKQFFHHHFSFISFVCCLRLASFFYGLYCIQSFFSLFRTSNSIVNKSSMRYKKKRRDKFDHAKTIKMRQSGCNKKKKTNVCTVHIIVEWTIYIYIDLYVYCNAINDLFNKTSLGIVFAQHYTDSELIFPICSSIFSSIYNKVICLIGIQHSTKGEGRGQEKTIESLNSFKLCKYFIKICDNFPLLALIF